MLGGGNQLNGLHPLKQKSMEPHLPFGSRSTAKHYKQTQWPVSHQISWLSVWRNLVWQSRWDTCTSNKLHSIKPLIGNTLNHLSRHDSAVMRRLRIGHTRLTHSYLLNKDDQPQCSFCDCELTVVHFLIDCPHSDVIRRRHFSTASLKELFDTVRISDVIAFTRDISLYHRI